METEKLLTELTDVFKKVFDNNEIILAESTSASDIKKWDSLTHILLITEIEKYFKIRFAYKEIYGFKNVGNMIDCINSKIGK